MKTINRPKPLIYSDDEREDNVEEAFDPVDNVKIFKPWDPIRRHFHEDSSDEDDDRTNINIRAKDPQSDNEGPGDD